MPIVLCHVFYEGQLYEEDPSHESLLKAPHGAYIRFRSGNWYRLKHGFRDPINLWDVPEELKPVLLLLDIPWPKAFPP